MRRGALERTWPSKIQSVLALDYVECKAGDSVFANRACMRPKRQRAAIPPALLAPATGIRYKSGVQYEWDKGKAAENLRNITWIFSTPSPRWKTRTGWR